MFYPTASFPLLKLKVKGTSDDNNRPSIIFWGTPEFAAIILDKLINSPFKPKAVVTAPDKPVGRKQVLTPSPVKQLALKYNILVLQPENLKNKNWESEIRNLKPDLMIVAAYGLILPPEILEIPRYGSLNVHPSLLPKYRGPSPIQATILNGDQETGITIILMDEKVDHGPIVRSKKINIKNKKFTYLELSELLANLGADLLIETLPKWIAGEIQTVPQNHLKATFTKLIKKEDGKINWTKSAKEIERLTRAYYPWPGTYTKINSKFKTLDQKNLKIIKADILKINHQLMPGTIFLTKDKNLAVACGQNALILEKIQLEGKKQMTAEEFLNGYPGIINSFLV